MSYFRISGKFRWIYSKFGCDTPFTGLGDNNVDPHLDVLKINPFGFEPELIFRRSVKISNFVQIG